MRLPGCKDPAVSVRVAVFWLCCHLFTVLQCVLRHLLTVLCFDSSHSSADVYGCVSVSCPPCCCLLSSCSWFIVVMHVWCCCEAEHYCCHGDGVKPGNLSENKVCIICV